MLNDIAIRLYRRFFKKVGGGADLFADTVLDGNSAAALAEAGVCSAAAVSGSGPAAETLWRQLVWQRDTNVFGEHLQTLESEGPRGAIAAASGLTLAGCRATAFLSGTDLAGCDDLLRSAVGRHLPLVVHMVNQATPAQGYGVGSGHETLHQISDSGCFLLFAANVQQVADLSLIARRVAETALIPGIVVMDREATARSAQELSVPAPDLLHEYLGPAHGEMPSPTPAQQLLFGENRRTVPLWHDLNRPMMLGTRMQPEAYALGSAGQGPYFQDHLGELIDRAFERYGELSGRPYGMLSTWGMEDADQVILIQGAAEETARAAADYLRGEGLKTGVLGLRCLRPFPASLLLEQLAGRSGVLVMERLDTPAAGDPPLLRELRAAFARALENNRFGAGTHADLPRLDAHQLPRLHSVVYGLGGAPLQGADMVACLRKPVDRPPGRTYLGLRFYGTSNAHPKRQVLLDQIRRAYPGIEKLGLRAQGSPPDLRPDGALSIEIRRLPGRGGQGLAFDAAALLQQLAGGRIRTLSAPDEDDCAAWLTDRLIRAPQGPGYPGNDAPVDLALIASPDRSGTLAPLPNLCEKGVLILVGNNEKPAALQPSGGAFPRVVRERQAVIYRLPESEYRSHGSVHADTGPGELDDAFLLGGLCSVLMERGLIDTSESRLLSSWAANLSGTGTERREALLAALEAGTRAPVPFVLDTLEDSDSASPEAWEDIPPPAVRQLGSVANTYDSLSRFWDQTGILYRNGEQDDLTSDPFMAIGAVPPLTSSFRDLSDLRRKLPVYDAAACSGCGACWSACPDSAIGVTAFTPAGLLNAGIKGAGADAVRQVSSKLAARIGSLCSSGELQGENAGDLLRGAWTWLLEKAPLPESRRGPIQAGIDAMAEQLGKLPLSVTENLFGNLEQVDKGSGALLSLAINPDSCKSCGICVEACDDDALHPATRETGMLSEARRLWQIWEEAADVPGELIDHAIAAGMDPLAARLLSHKSARLMAGGDGAEPGSGEKIALRLAIAVMDTRIRPWNRHFSDNLAELQEQIKSSIRETLANALPTDDLKKLTGNLHHIGDQLTELTRGGGPAALGGKTLSNLIELALALENTRLGLDSDSAGDYGSNLGLVIAPGTLSRWACLFPDNPFHLPATLDTTGDGAQVAAGLVKGQMMDRLNAIALSRQARKALDPRAAETEPRGTLSWESLTPAEQEACPPVILVGNEAELGGRGLAQVTWLLNSELPVKILVMCELDLGLDKRRHRAGRTANAVDPRTDLGLMALAQRRAYVAQTSFAETAHFCDTLNGALGFAGPALVRIHTPSPSRHGYPSRHTLEQARLAIRCRAFPLFRYDPEGEGVFGSRITLEGNPDPDSDWVSDEQGRPLTPAAWACTETRFAGHFAPIAEEDTEPLAIDRWLGLDARARDRKTPALEVGESESTRISPALARCCESLAQAWQTLQELSGHVTPFTERVNREAEQRVAHEHQAELDRLQAEHAARLEELQQGLQGEIAGQIRERLLVLAGYK